MPRRSSRALKLICCQYQYLDNGKHDVAGAFPTAIKKFFDSKNSTSVFDTLAASEPKWPTHPCEDCPSAGDGSAVPATGGQT